MRREASTRLRVAAVLAVIALGVIVSPAGPMFADLVGKALGIPRPRGIPADLAPRASTGSDAPPAGTSRLPSARSATPREVARAKDIARSDRGLKALLHGVPYAIVHEGPWSGPAGNSIGVVLFVNLDRPTNVKGMWSAALFAPGRQSYTEKARDLVVRATQAILIQVDLRRRVVAGELPLQYRSMSAVSP